MNIIKIETNREPFKALMLLADEQEEMLYRYYHTGDLFALYDPDLIGICLVINYDATSCELKNMAVYPAYQGKGYGRILLEYVCQHLVASYTTMYVGTGDSPLTIPFYQNCGFSIDHRVKNFFLDHYDHPIIEAGIQLKDMIYLKKTLKID